LFPAALVTGLRVIQESFWTVVINVFKFVFWPTASIIVGATLGVLLNRVVLQTQFYENLLSTGLLKDAFFQIGYLLFLAASLFYASRRLECDFGSRACLWQVLSFVLQVVGIILITVSLLASGAPAPNVSSSNVDDMIDNVPYLGLLEKVASEISVVAFGFTSFFLLPVVAGAKTAEIAVDERILSQVASLSSTQKLPSLKNHLSHETGSTPKSESISVKRMWFSRLNVELDVAPSFHNYCFGLDEPLYLLQNFHGRLALYFPADEDRESRLFLLSDDLVQVLVLYSSSVVTDKTSAKRVNSQSVGQ
jgi:hypothetical protein